MLRPGPVLVFTALLLLLPALPDLLFQPEQEGAPPPTLSFLPRRQRPEPPLPPLQPSQRPLALLESGLLESLSQADRDWIPRAEPLPDGGTRYLYKRRVGDPELTIPQIQALIARPPSYVVEHNRIRSLLAVLDRAGAAVELADPLKIGAAAEWDPQARTLRLQPELPQRGSVEFARVLNHEAIHVAQSCAAGGLRASPRPLGLHPLPARSAASGDSGGIAPQGPTTPLDDPVYANLTPLERRMEEEAYALQHRLELGEKLVRLHCLT